MEGLDLLIKPASSLCNMRCKYCFYADVASCRNVSNYGIMSKETQEILVKNALGFAKKYCIFAFQGGEPTLAGIEFYKRQVELQKKYNKKRVQITNSIQTNGYIINDEWAEFFAKNNFLVGLSFDGPRAIQDELRIDANKEGTFDKLMNAVKLFKKYGVQFNILSVVSKPVAQNAKSVYNFYRQNNFKFLQYIECLDPFDNQKHEYSLTVEDYEKFLKVTFDEYYKDFKNKNYTSIRTFDNFVRMAIGLPSENCGMSGVCTAYLLVESNGNVYPCDFYVLDKYYMGNIHTNTFEELTNSIVAKNFVIESTYVMEECRKCQWYSMCRGGCKRYREPFINNRPSINKYCSAYKSFFNYAYKRLEGMGNTLQMKSNKQ